MGHSQSVTRRIQIENPNNVESTKQKDGEEEAEVKVTDVDSSAFKNTVSSAVISRKQLLLKLFHDMDGFLD